MSSLQDNQKEALKNLVKSAGSLFLKYYNASVEIISDEGRDIKVIADQCIEEIITSGLKLGFDYPVLGEEFGGVKEFDISSFTGFVLDPVDGTMNFSRQNPMCCISLAFMNSGDFEYGIIFNPVLDEMYEGDSERGAFFNGAKLDIGKNLVPEKAILCSGIPTRMDISDKDDFVNYLLKLKKFKKVRMIGSAALSISWISIGRVDAYMENSIMIWDVAAGIAIVKASGGEFLISSDGKGSFSFNVKVAANKLLLDALV